MKKTIYCTIVAANYLARAVLLGRSLQRHNPGADFRILLAERPEVVRDLKARFPELSLLSPDQIECSAWLEMAFYYDVMEYCTALKPFLLGTLCRDSHAVYLDPDIEIFDTMAEVEAVLETADIVLTPHVTRPVPEDGCHPTMLQILRTGQFNLGFIGVASGQVGLDLMQWWRQVLEEGALSDLASGLFTDQFWANAFASFASRVHIFRSGRLNLAYWNLMQHTFSLDDQGSPVTEEGRVVFFHYSGLSRGVETHVSKYCTRELAPVGSDLHRFLVAYLDRLTALDQELAIKHLPYSFGRFADGTPIRAKDRRLYLAMDKADRAAHGAPFASRQAFDHFVRHAPGRSGRRLGLGLLASLDWLLAKMRDEIFRIFRRRGNGYYMERTRLNGRR